MNVKEKFPLVYFIVLNYNNASDTIECVHAVEQINYSNFQIVLVDNLSTDDSETILKKNLPEHHFIQTNKNLGYANGNNIGIDYAIQNGASYVCILNNDVLVEPDFLSILVDYSEKNPEVGVVGPRVCTYEDETILESAGSVVDLNHGKVTRLYSGKNETEVYGKEIFCDYIGGACMLVSTSVIQSVGVIPEIYFLFYEENEWCLKIGKAGFAIACIADAKVVHKGSASINKVSGLSEYFMYRNLIVFMKRNSDFRNKLRFYPYILLFTLKSGLTKKRGWRFLGYFLDGFTGKNKYSNRL
ncbi:glycosyltransferase family 2 protein [Carnobacterium sp. FSL E2-0243]|uniref:glycosyltransferase family 2 protein n=1 Tax=Carnobacterium sp. FSL E2-0243 TaxID=2921365 RepID=UPI0030F89F00